MGLSLKKKAIALLKEIAFQTKPSEACWNLNIESV